MSRQRVLVVGQSGGPTPVINASLAGLIEGARAGFDRTIGLRHGVEGALTADLVDLTSLSDADLDTLRRTPAAALGSCRHKLSEREEQGVLDTFARHGVTAFAYIGGNDSMDTCARLERRARRDGQALVVYGVPKTIDNDLVGTDHCPGYGSAARYWAACTQEVTRDLAAMRTYDRVLVLECAGRNAGWLTAATALFKRDERDGPHVLLVPEQPFDADQLLAAVEAVLRRIGYCVVAAAETIRDAAGQYVAQSQAGVDRFGHPIVTAVGERLAQVIGAALDVKARANKPGTLQRTSMAHVSPVDRHEADAAGRAAAERLARGETGSMVTFVRRSDEPYDCDLGATPLVEVANGERRLPPEFLEESAGPAEAVGEAFRRYALPLLGPAPEPLGWLALTPARSP